MTRLGRPPRSHTVSKNLTIRITDSEHETWLGACDGLTISEWIRTVCNTIANGSGGVKKDG